MSGKCSGNNLPSSAEAVSWWQEGMETGYTRALWAQALQPEERRACLSLQAIEYDLMT